eukprot:m.160792 g.160792  ORF g.160792 m.160792 type:complete len:60 (+) comp16510_c0_seq9:11-190(+)
MSTAKCQQLISLYTRLKTTVLLGTALAIACRIVRRRRISSFTKNQYKAPTIAQHLKHLN